MQDAVLNCHEAATAFQKARFLKRFPASKEFQARLGEVIDLCGEGHDLFPQLVWIKMQMELANYKAAMDDWNSLLPTLLGGTNERLGSPTAVVA